MQVYFINIYLSQSWRNRNKFLFSFNESWNFTFFETAFTVTNKNKPVKNVSIHIMDWDIYQNAIVHATILNVTMSSVVGFIITMSVNYMLYPPSTFSLWIVVFIFLKYHNLIDQRKMHLNIFQISIY